MVTGLTEPFQLSGASLRRSCLLDDLKAQEPGSANPHLGQERAVDAIRFALKMDSDGYNIFVLGPAGSRRHHLSETLAKEHARGRPVPEDWCYVNNFANPRTPRALAFPPGQGKVFQDDVHALIEELSVAIPAAFESEEFRGQLSALEAETQSKIEEQWQDLEQHAAEEDIGLLQTPTGYVLAPVFKGHVVSNEEFAKLPEEIRNKSQDAIRRLSGQLRANIERMPQIQKEHRQGIKALERQALDKVVGLLINELRQRYEDLPAVAAHLDDVRSNIIDNAQDFREPEPGVISFPPRDRARALGIYEVNLIVPNTAGADAPVIYEPNPTYQNIIGKIEHRAELGTLTTDFRMIQAGALHQANGGYLIVDAHRVLQRPFVWEALKQSLIAKRVRIESPGDTYGLVSTTTLQPDHIPIDVKILMIGERRLYYLLCAYDPEFSELFNVAAEFEEDFERSPEHETAYAVLIADRARELGLLSFEKPALERVIEQLSRWAGDNERLTTDMRSLTALLRHADSVARDGGKEIIETADVESAIESRLRRLNRAQMRTIDAIRRNLILIDTQGEQIGQVNGLSVAQLGEFRFGHPVRITATTRTGDGIVVDIEREVELGGAIHSKGMMILSAALASRYAANAPLSMRGSVVFEQSYGSVEGDSASVAELCALLSSLSAIPINQSLAVTGSINQHGRIQVVGGINEKIEGFYDVCKTRGMDGSHGVVIPRENVTHLMLRPDVVDAVEQGLFKILAVEHIDEAISILTGVTAGERGENGEFPPDTVNGRVERQLAEYAAQRKRFSSGTEDHERKP